MTDLASPIHQSSTGDDSPALLTVTQAAREVVAQSRSQELDGDTLALWLEAAPTPGGGFRYDMYFQPQSDIAASDEIIELGEGLLVVVPAVSAPRIAGSTLDIVNGGMMLTNPNDKPKPAPSESTATATGNLEGPLAARVLEVIETQVNPSIASHGGFATLVSVDGDTVFITMGGGCQGCASSKATLRQGIEVAIKQNVPEIRHVVDVTDHAGGSNPYYS